MRLWLKHLSALAFLLSGAMLPAWARPAEASEARIVRAYAEAADLQHSRALAAARKMQAEVNALVSAPDPQKLAAAQAAWRLTRSEFLKLEPLRFFSTPVDDDDGPLPRMDSLMKDNGAAVEAQLDRLDDPDALTADSVAKRVLAEPESVISGFPVVEYFLWPQDRPALDKRRGAYLQACSDLLRTDLDRLSAEWTPGKLGNYRAMFTEGVKPSLQGLLSALCLLGEAQLAGARLQMALDAPDPLELPSTRSRTTRQDLLASISGLESFGRILQPLVAELDQKLADTLASQFSATNALASQLPVDLLSLDANGRGLVIELIHALESQSATLRIVGQRLGFILPTEILTGDEAAENLAIAIPSDPAARSGGDCTIFNGGSESFGRVLANATGETRRLFLVGNSFFTEARFQPGPHAGVRGGLGPLFHAQSCAACHIRAGRGGLPEQPPWTAEPGLLLRISQPGEDAHGGPLPDPVYGVQLAPLAFSPERPEIEAQLTWQETPGTYADGQPYSLRKPLPKITTWHRGQPSPTSLVSLRFAPPVFGLGLLEAIDEKDLLAQSGKPNYVWDAEANQRRLGRFGWKANMADLRQQTITAFAEDMGVTHTGSPPEISNPQLQRVVTYLQALAPPARRSLDDPSVVKGETLFRQLQCASCHRETFTTGSQSSLVELRHQTIHPYTDLMLHDMGEGLSDSRPEYLATGREWRTAPLWGLGLNDTVNGHTALLHDGRARNPGEAILWHGGEAAGAAEAFRQLPASQRLELLSFLRSL